MKNVETPVLAQSKEFPPADHNCYDYFLKNTEQYGEYTVFSHYGREHKNPSLLPISKPQRFISKTSLGLRRAMCTPSFLPQTLKA